MGKNFFQKMLYDIKIIITTIFTVQIFTNTFLMQILKREIHIDNKIMYDKEVNIDFSSYSSSVKPIAIYSQDNNNIFNKNENQIDNNTIINEFRKVLDFAKNHGIFGFAFYYQFNSEIKFLYDPLNIIIRNKNFKINYFIIFNNSQTNNYTKDINTSRIFKDIKMHIMDERYIKFHNKYLIGVSDDRFSKKIIKFLKKKFYKNKLGEIFILSRTYHYNITRKKKKLYNGFYYSPHYTSIKKVKFRFNNTYNYFYINLIYHHLLTINRKNDIVYRMSEAINEYPIFLNKTQTLFWDYSPEKFYILNKVIINWTKSNFEKDNQYIFINNFNSLLKDNFLGYANINSFSKALFELPFIMENIKKFKINKLSKGIFILIQVHIFYIDLVGNIINKTNNMPVPYDLYITTDTEEKKNYIQNDLKIYSKANKYEILIVPNKGRDVIPCLIQLKDFLKRYKYFCHIHTKKHPQNLLNGKYWQEYLFENLLGKKSFIKQILSDFENHKKLGFIFPEPFYFINHISYSYTHLNYYYVHKIFDILFPNLNIWPGNFLIFPVGNMFWAKTKAVYQIFNEKVIKLVPEENGQNDNTILHAIERFWLYLVKINGFYYKTILYYI